MTWVIIESSEEISWLKKEKKDWEKNLLSLAEEIKIQEEKLVTDDKVSTFIIASNISNRLK